MAEGGCDVVELAAALIARPSLTPDDAGCQDLIAERLARAGFAIERLRFGAVDNLWATHGQGAPVFCLLGHTDVVPSGPVSAWRSDPFRPELRDGRLYGRGAADMKGSVAAFVVALEQLVRDWPDHPGTLALLLTSDEEGPAVDGVRRVAQRFRERGQRIDACLVGEPSSRQRLGDVVRVGRRGSLTATLGIEGVQGHVAYPELADNPIHRALPALVELAQRRWDETPYPEFPSTGFQIASFQAGTGAANVIPGQATVVCNWRYSPRWSADALIEETGRVLARHGVRARIDWHRSGEPFHTAEGPLRRAVREVLRRRLGLSPEENTGGGTSDGRFIAPLGAEVVELGPCNASIHQVDENIELEALRALPGLYAGIAAHYLRRAGQG